MQFDSFIVYNLQNLCIEVQTPQVMQRYQRYHMRFRFPTTIMNDNLNTLEWSSMERKFQVSKQIPNLLAGSLTVELTSPK